ncbi:hypothetical protein BJ741DRAFT_579189 [Chytriomyces cf. hyalinus JEL632]|nr:hypothetical protein BJ741DRAFT_579189 [Chytriomyces cf. hyalinus JEL632]
MEYTCLPLSARRGRAFTSRRSDRLGAVVVTNTPSTDAEVKDGVSGILVYHKGSVPEDYQLMGDYERVGVDLRWENVCKAVEKVLGMYLEAREEMGRLARLRYEEDSRIMAKNLRILK